MSTSLAALQAVHTMVHADMPTVQHAFGQPQAIANPFDGIVPNFSVFGAKFDALWKKLFAGFWAICIILTGARLLGSFVTMAQHRGGNHPSQLAEARADVVKAAQAFAAVIGFSIIVGLFFFLIS